MSNYKRYFAENKLIFITIVTHERRDILIQNINILRNSFAVVKKQFQFNIIAINVLKNHLHFILEIKNQKDTPQIIRFIKYNFSKNIPNVYINKNLSKSAIRRNEKGVWQRRYYDHIIRNEEDLQKHIDYIHYNSVKHYNIMPKDWNFSSFKKFVKNGYYDIDWCNFEDKNNINGMDYE